MTLSASKLKTLSETVLHKLELPSFEPFPFLTNGVRQTIAAYYFPYNPILCDEKQHIVELADGDKVVLVENVPAKARASGRIALLLHGLSGSHRSKYLIRITQQLLQDGYHVFRMNLRGCGAGKGLSRKLYHSGRSEDSRTVIQWLQHRFPNRPVTQIGFSLGANITLKMAGEDAEKPNGNLDSVVAVSPPLDLHSSVKLIIHPKNQVFNHYFMKGLRRDADAWSTDNSHNLHEPKIIQNVLDFDNHYTAYHNGFENAVDYYNQCSAKHFAPSIELPTFILYSADDPVITRRSFFKLPTNRHLDIVYTQQGGHVAWLGNTSKRFRFRWMDQAVVSWVNWLDSQ